MSYWPLASAAMNTGRSVPSVSSIWSPLRWHIPFVIATCAGSVLPPGKERHPNAGDALPRRLCIVGSAAGDHKEQTGSQTQQPIRPFTAPHHLWHPPPVFPALERYDSCRCPHTEISAIDVGYGQSGRSRVARYRSSSAELIKPVAIISAPIWSIFALASRATAAVRIGTK